MNIESIKNRARQVLMTNKEQYIRVLVIVLVLNVLPSLLSATNIFIVILSLIATIIFLPVTHGTIVASLKMVRNNAGSVSDSDGLVGFKRFGELFPTYLLSSIIEFFIMFILSFVLGIIIVLLSSNSLVNLIYSLLYGDTMSAIMNLFVGSPLLIILILIFALILLVVSFVVGAYLYPVPYLLEQYQLTGMNNIKTSFKMMKNHIMDYIKLFFSFFVWMVIVSIIQTALSQFISNSLIVSVITGVIEIFTYLPLYNLSKTVMFEEISFYYFGQDESEGM